MMDIRVFEAEMEKLRSGFSFDTTKLCGMYAAALARAEAAEAKLAGGGLRELLDKRHDEWRDACDERDRALARAEAAITESNSVARRAFGAEVENQRLTKEAAGLRARAEAAEAEAYERLEAALFAEQRATDAELFLSEIVETATALKARIAELEAALDAEFSATPR